MAINILAPGIISEVKDLSDYVETTPSTSGLIAMICEQGPDNQLVRVTRQTFYEYFGEPNISYTNDYNYGMGPYVASQFLEESNNLYVMRCLPSTAEFSNLFITTTTSLVSVDATTGLPSSAQSITCDTSSFDNMNVKVELESQLSALTDLSGYTLVGFYGVGRGEFYNNYQIDLNKHPLNGNPADNRLDLYVIDIYKKQSFTNRFSTADGSGSTYVDYALVESFDVSFNPESKDPAGVSQFIEDVVNNYSKHLRCVASKAVLKEIYTRQTLDNTGLQLTIDFSEGFVKSHSFTSSFGTINAGYGINLAYGSTGGMFTQYGLTTDTTALFHPKQLLARAYSGLLESYDDSSLTVSEVIDTENFSFDVVLDAGYPTDVKTQIVNLANVRRDCLAIVDSLDNKTANLAIADRTSALSGFNTPYAALYEPYTKVYDKFTGKDLWVPPSFHVAKVLGFSDRTTEVWYPLAGFNRAVIQSIKEMRYNPALGDRENFIKWQINPIVKFNEGYSIFSQRTTMKKTSAQNDINVVRLTIFIDKALRNFCNNYIFEINDSETWTEISEEINKFLREVKSRRGLESFSVSVGATEWDKKARRVNVDITFTPVRAIEQIHLTYYIKQ